jgi:hypothetical protein
VKSETVSKLAKYLFLKADVRNLFTKLPDFLTRCFNCPIRGRSSLAKYFASSYVRELIQLTIGLRGTSI